MPSTPHLPAGGPDDEARRSLRLEALQQVASGLAREFDDLLSVVLVNGSLALESLPAGESAARPLLEELRAAAARCGDLVHRLMAFGGSDALALVSVDVVPLIGDVGVGAARAGGPALTVRPELPDRPLAALADPAALAFILQNLVSNAREALPAGGVLTLSASEAILEGRRATQLGLAGGSHVIISVADSGPGFTSEARRRVFEPFFTTKGRGTAVGLGLATSLGLARRQGGALEIEHQEGAGTTVRLFLRHAPAPATRAAAAPASAAGITILLVEDEELVRRAAVRILEREGYRVIEAFDGEEALEQFHRHRAAISLVVTDVVMPRMGGFQLAETLRGLQPSLPVLCMSGYAEGRHGTVQPLPVGIPFLHKPWRSAELLERVRALLDAR